MAVDDLWFSSRRRYGPDGKKLPPTPTKRHGRGRRWRVRYIDDAGVKREKLFADGKKGEAERFDASVRTDVARGTYIDRATGQQTFESYATGHHAAQLYRPGTAELVERTLRRHIYPLIGRLPMAQIRPGHIQSWVKNVDLAPSTTRVAYSHLVAIFGAAVRDRVITVSPCVGIKLPVLPDS